MYKIYTLTCPISSQIVYVGLTSKKLSERLKAHCTGIGSKSKIDWIKSVRRIGIKIKQIDQTKSMKKAFELERFWHDQLVCWGFKLFNVGYIKSKMVQSIIYYKSISKEDLKRMEKHIKCHISLIEHANTYKKQRVDFEKKIQDAVYFLKIDISKPLDITQKYGVRLIDSRTKYPESKTGAGRPIVGV
jgi:predicted GIY-YIG superfamily endonuclease